MHLAACTRRVIAHYYSPNWNQPKVLSTIKLINYSYILQWYFIQQREGTKLPEQHGQISTKILNKTQKSTYCLFQLQKVQKVKWVSVMRWHGVGVTVAGTVVTERSRGTRGHLNCQSFSVDLYAWYTSGSVWEVYCALSLHSMTHLKELQLFKIYGQTNLCHLKWAVSGTSISPMLHCIKPKQAP